MTMVLIKNIKEYCAERKAAMRNIIQTEYIDKGLEVPTLAVIQVGNNEASNRYIKHKSKDCEEVGLGFIHYKCDENTSETDIIDAIKTLSESVDGIIVQLPLPPHISVSAITAAIDPSKDVDGFGVMSKFDPCTPKGIIDYLSIGCNYDFCGKHAVVIGRSDIVGKPVARMLTDRNATVTLCHSKTKGLSWFVGKADLIVCAVGKAKFLNCYPIYCPVIDVGINFDENGKLVGDCYNTECRDVTPVPGGVGLLTRVALLENVIAAAGSRAV